jgi:hypothetical protein
MARLSTAPRVTVTSGVSFRQHSQQFSDAPISAASIVIMARSASAGRQRLRVIVTEQWRRFENTCDPSGSFTTSNTAAGRTSQVTGPRFLTRISIISPIKLATYA